MFDYQHYAPAVDLAFSFPEDYDHPVPRISREQARNINVNDMEWNNLKKVLLYFSKRTNGDLRSAGINSSYFDLVQRGVDKCFIRAVVYFLYPDPMLVDGEFAGKMAKLFDLHASMVAKHCSFCNQSGSLKKCKQCGTVQYCNTECQRKHWRRHKGDCKKLAKSKCK